MTMLMEAKGHPKGVSLKDALSEDTARQKAQKGLIDKKATLIKAADGDEDTVSETIGATMRPSDEQLEQINRFTRRPVTADEVVAFTTLSCNDIPDRDDDFFSTQCVKDFAALEQPYSSVGKSYMVDHDYKISNAMGRIFGVDTKKISGALFLTNEVYVPKTEANTKFIEDIDFGINWAVSVGVVLGKSACTVCSERFSSWGYWCVNGHDKGAYYDPNSDETDSWGYPVACDPSTKGAIKCLRQFDDPKDYYELSQVFLGAQFYASLEKMPDFGSVMKAATSGVPTIGLTAEEARKLPLRHEPEKVSEARIRFGVEELEDGSLKWVDDQRIIWSFDPEDQSVASLGRKAADEDDDSEVSEDDGESQEDEEADGTEGVGEGELDPDGEGTLDQGADDGAVDRSGAGSGDATGGDGAAGGDESLGGEPGEVVAAATDEEKSVSKKHVQQAAQKAGLPPTLLSVLEGAEGNGLDALLLAAAEQINSTKELAAVGEQTVAKLKGDAIAMYVKAHATGEGERVNTETFEKLLNRCGNDIELLQEMIGEQTTLAQARFPKAASFRRSSAPGDGPNERKEVSNPDFGDESDKKVSKLHG